MQESTTTARENACDCMGHKSLSTIPLRPQIYSSYRSEALFYLHSIREPKGRQARWLQKINHYEFSIEHKPGRDHQDVDALSRKPGLQNATRGKGEEEDGHPLCAVTGWRQGIPLRDMARLQRNDKTLKEIIQRMEQGLGRTRPTGIWRQPLLPRYRLVWDTDYWYDIDDQGHDKKPGN